MLQSLFNTAVWTEKAGVDNKIHHEKAAFTVLNALFLTLQHYIAWFYNLHRILKLT
jgi:hypothetical protein